MQGVSGRVSQMSGQIKEGEISQKKVTEQKPFNLTKPKPKVIPRPLELPRETKGMPIPPNLFKKDVGQIEKEKADRRKNITENIRKGYEDAPK